MRAVLNSERPDVVHFQHLSLWGSRCIQIARQSGARESISSIRPGVPAGKVARARAMCPCSTRVYARRSSSKEWISSYSGALRSRLLELMHAQARARRAEPAPRYTAASRVASRARARAWRAVQSYG